MTYRSDLDALEARHEALAADVAARTRDLEDTKQLLDDARAKIRLPVLDDIRVAAPCTADWSKMTGDARVRHCADCNKHVYNLSEMTRDEAQALLIEHSPSGKLCVRYYRRNDGTILTANCPVGTKRRRRRRWIAASAVAMLAGVVGGRFVNRRHAAEPVMGDVGAPPEIVMGKTATPPPVATPIEPDHELVMGQMVAPVKPAATR